ncbi:SCO3374 family protein [Streptomyces sp. NPDC088400]|uniref:SCO3374 family protein n=1 Tax=Streptomyces sp. NPDC088400 TaxID=3365861 RepID=UPI00381B7EE7
MAFTVPLPRVPLEGGRDPAEDGRTSLEDGRAPLEDCHAPLEDDCAQWYEDGLGWATASGPPVQLLTGLRFEVLELPADAGAAVLRRIGPTGPVALHEERMLLLVAAGSADELPGLLDWLEWGTIALDLTAVGAGGRVAAPAPPQWPRATARGAAVWLRPPDPGREVEPTLPALAPFGRSSGHGGGGTDAPDLVRLVDTAATECHRARLLRGNTLRTNTQPLAFS